MRPALFGDCVRPEDIPISSPSSVTGGCDLLHYFVTFSIWSIVNILSNIVCTEWQKRNGKQSEAEKDKLLHRNGSKQLSKLLQILPLDLNLFMATDKHIET